MTTLRLEFRRDRRRLPRHTQIDWGQFANADADTMLAQIGDQMRNELEQHVSNVAAYVQASTQASSVRVTVDPLQRADESGIESPTGAYLACAVAFVEAPLVNAHIRLVAETVAMWNRLYVLPSSRDH
jgi:hypothetical protein